MARRRGVKVTIKSGAKARNPKLPKMGRSRMSATKIKVSKSKRGRKYC